MTRAQRSNRSSRLLVALVVVLVPMTLIAAERKKRAMKLGEYNPDDETVEMFEAMEAGVLDVKFIPKNEHEGQIFIENKTKKPLNVKMPEAFAGVPVLAQGGFGGGGGGFGGGGGGGGGQGIGGGGGGGRGGGGGFQNIPPERLGKLKVETLCLEHGKADPRPAMKYKIVPIDQFTDKAEVAELLKLYAEGKFSRAGAQAAAWHISNGMSWQELAAKRIERANGISYPYFNQEQLREAMAMANAAVQLAREQSPTSPGELAETTESADGAVLSTSAQRR